MNIWIKRTLFGIIISVGFVFRFYELGNVPDSLNWDEVSWGYNAYSIAETFHDEHGDFMPLTFEAFGDYKQPVYVYLTAASVKMFGLNAFAVRAPSAILGVLTIPFVFLLVYSLFRKNRDVVKISFAAMALFAISPWSIQFSRVAYEANVGLFFLIAGSALFIYGLSSERTKYLYLAMIPFVISGYSYHSQKLFTPLLLVVLLSFAYFAYKLRKKTIVIMLFIFLAGSIFWILDSRTTARGRSVTFVSSQTELLKDSTQRLIYSQENNEILGQVMNNRRVVYAQKYTENYLSHFNPNYLFLNGDNARHHAYGMGILYLVSLPFIIIGMVKIDKRYGIVVFGWFLLAPVASSLAIDAPNASRSMVFLPTWHLFEAIGLIYILQRYWMRKIVVGFIVFLYLFSVGYFTHQYFAHTNSEYDEYWQGGYREAIEKTLQLDSKSKVVFSSSFEQPHIFYLFYTKYNPSKYIAEGGSKRIKSSCYTIENVYFGECQKELVAGDFFILSGEKVPSGMKKVEDLRRFNGEIFGGIYKYL